jgi:hypothetical protein
MLLIAISPALLLAGERGYNPPADSSYYQTRRILIGYPPRDIDRSHLPAPSLDDDLRVRMWLTDPDFDDITPAKAEQKAKQAAQAGMNVVDGQGNRYLFFEEGDTSALRTGAMTPPKTLDQVIAETKMMVDACHRHGVHYVHHLTSTQVTLDYWERHPAYRSIDIATGEPIITQYRTAAVCAANPDWQKDYLTRLERLVRETGIDGLFVDEIVLWRPTACGCDSCRTRFKADTGYDLPQNADGDFFGNLDNPAYLIWLRWRQRQLIDFNKKVSEIARLNGGVRYEYSSNHSGTGSIFVTYGWSHDNALEYVDLFGYEYRAHGHRTTGYIYNWPIGLYETKLMRTVSDHVGSTPWMLPAVRHEGGRTWAWMLHFSQGGNSWWRSGSEKSWQPLADWERGHDDLVLGTVPGGNVGVLFSVESATHAQLRGDRDWELGTLGMCAALSDSHIAYRAVLRQDIEQGRLEAMGVDTLVLPGVDTMYDQTIDAVRRFVAAGGTLIATGAPASYDAQTYQPRADDALADVLGLSEDDELAQPVTHAFGNGRAIYLPDRPDRRCVYIDPQRNPLEVGSDWQDMRDQQARRDIARAVQSGGEPAMVLSDLPRGVVAELYRQQYGAVRSVQVRLINFTGGILEEGFIPALTSMNFPAIEQPIEVAVRAADVQQVLVISPDYDTIVKLPFEQNGPFVRTTLPRLDRAAAVCFVQAGLDRVRELAGGAFADQLPEPVELLYDEYEPFVGEHDPDAIVIFADAERMSGGRYVVPWQHEITRTIYGEDSPAREISATFELDAVSANATFELAGLNGLGHPDIQLQIELNGKLIYDRISPFRSGRWSLHSIPLDSQDLRAGENVVRIRNMNQPVEGEQISWLTINFIRIHR